MISQCIPHRCGPDTFREESSATRAYGVHSTPGDTSLGFERYLLETRGRTAGENAFQRGLRADFIFETPERFEGAPAPQVSNTSNDRCHLVNAVGDPFPSPPNQYWGRQQQRSRQLITTVVATLPSKTDSIITEISTWMPIKAREA
ncbi:hypothetical protein BJX65DRAFT_188924 [Aspergillus insuetus]